MNFGRRSSEKCAAAPAIWSNEMFTGDNRTDDWLCQTAARFRSAITLQIPVGYQDATGFHRGVPGRAASRLSANERNDAF